MINMYAQRHANPTHIAKQRRNALKMSTLHTWVVTSCMWLVAFASALLFLDIPLTASEHRAKPALDWFPVRTKMLSRSQGSYSKSSLNHITKVPCDVCRAAIQLEMTLGCVLTAWIYFIVSLNCNQVARCYSFPHQSVTSCIHSCQPWQLSKHSSGTSLVYIHTLVQCSLDHGRDLGRI